MQTAASNSHKTSPGYEPKPCRGVNVCGYFRTESGVGAATRGYLRALQALGLSVSLTDVSGVSINRSEDRSVEVVDGGGLHDVNLICADVEIHYAVLAHVGEKFFEGRYNIGVWWWEQTRFPKKWYDRFAYYDEIWVGTSFIANTLAPVAPVPVVRIPPVLTGVTGGSRSRGRRRLGVMEEEVVYLFVFDGNSIFERKNPVAVIDAFKKAFKPSDPVRLVLKCVNTTHNQEARARIYARLGDYPISILEGYWSAQEMKDLMAACDAYVSLHRSEGMGLTISDAMLLGKPVIATGWSGNMDFMNTVNSLPVGYELAELKKNAGPYQAGALWAEPSVEHAAELMRFVFENPEEARARGKRARRDIKANYSEEKVADLIHDRLEAIAVRRDYAGFRRSVQNRFIVYQELPERIRNAVQGCLPPEATVLVVSKGDDELLKLERRRGWHFPQREDGVYAGYYPADSAAAIQHLEGLRAKGADYLLFPWTALWWLDHYREFKAHLDTHYRQVCSQEKACIVFDLRGSLNGRGSGGVHAKRPRALARRGSGRG